jgi:hypothetical protein
MMILWAKLPISKDIVWLCMCMRRRTSPFVFVSNGSRMQHGELCNKLADRTADHMEAITYPRQITRFAFIHPSLMRQRLEFVFPPLQRHHSNGLFEGYRMVNQNALPALMYSTISPAEYREYKCRRTFKWVRFIAFISLSAHHSLLLPISSDAV